LFFRKVDDAELRMPSSADLSCLNVADQIGYGDWLSRSFRNGIQQDMLRERLAQIGDAPGVHRLCGYPPARGGRHEPSPKGNTSQPLA
jgi:hypothetical protein